jgi:type VI secretion system secreted protein VgrG
VAVLGTSMALGNQPAVAAHARVGLGTAESFAVLAGSGITNTGATTITGDVGTFPTPSMTGFDTVTLTGTNHAGDAVTQGAKPDLTTAYNDAAGRTPFTNVPVELGGSRLLAGVYRSDTLGLTGTLTLDAQGDPHAQFVFQAASTLITASNSRVLLVNGANPCNVVWQIGSSATFGTGTRFVGDVLAHTSISANTAATFRGRLLARGGAVTLDNNTITNGTCAADTSGGGDGTTPTTAVGGTPTTSGDTSTPVTSSSGSPTPVVPGPGGSPPAIDLETRRNAPAPPSGPGSPTASPDVPTATPGPPTGSAGPPLSTPRTPTTGRPDLPLTGAQIAGIVATGLALVIAGTVARGAGRRRTARVV